MTSYSAALAANGLTERQLYDGQGNAFDIEILHCRIGATLQDWVRDPTTVRKLLIHRHEIDKLIGKTREKGQTLVPTKMYLKNGRVKVEIALAKGKQNYDKRETLKKREADAEAKAAIVRARRS